MTVNREILGQERRAASLFRAGPSTSRALPGRKDLLMLLQRAYLLSSTTRSYSG